MTDLDASTPSGRRAAVLARLAILDTDRERVFDDAVAIASAICEKPIAAISLLDGDRQWFKAEIGLNLRETPIEFSFCAHTVLHDGIVMEVPDAIADGRFADSAEAVAGLVIRFYAGAPLVMSDGTAVGAICVLDTKAGGLTDDQRLALARLGKMVSEMLDARGVANDLAEALRERDSATAAAQASRSNASALFQGVSVPLAVLEEDGHIRVMNPACADIVARDEADLGSFLTLVAEEQRAGEQALIAELFSGQVNHTVREINLQPSGALMVATSTRLRDASGATTGVLLQLDPIEDRRRAEAALQETQSAVDGIVTIDGEGRIESWNAGATRLLGYPASSVRGRDVELIVPAHLRPAHRSGMSALLGGRPPLLLGSTIEVDALCADGSLLPVELSLSRWYRREAPMYTAIIRDISERRTAQRREHWALRHDPETGLPNLLAMREETTARSEDAMGHRVLLLVQLDYLPEILASLSEAEEAVLLTSVGTQVRRASDLVGAPFYRVSDTRFACLFTIAPTMDEAELQQTAHDVTALCRGPYQHHAQELELSTRAAAVFDDSDLQDTDALLRVAATALTDDAKRVVFCLHSDLRPPHRGSWLLPARLRHALTHNELELYYQPVIATSPDNSATSPHLLEALIRWNHPEQGVLGPSAFIAEAEASSVISPITDWAILQACTQQQLWAQVGIDVKISVNISPHVLLNDDLVAITARHLTSSGCPPNRLKFEITESAIIADPNQAREMVRRIRHLGVLVSIDDFGTGYTSLNMLRTLHVDEIKLDQTFVRNILTNHTDAAIAAAVSTLAQNLGVTTIAEGVETPAVARKLTELGYDRLQGFLYGRPAPASEATLLMITDHDRSVRA